MPPRSRPPTRPARSPRAPRRSTRPGSTSSSGSPGRWWRGTRPRAPRCSTPRTAEFGANPIFGVQAEPRDLRPQARRSPTPRSRRRWSASSKASRPTSTTSPTGTARASRRAARRPTSRCGRPSSSSTTGWRRRSPRTRCSTVQEPPSDVDAARWHERLLAVVQQQVRPAVEHYRDVLRDEVAPQARPDERCGLTHLPDGDETYATAARASSRPSTRSPAGDPRDRAAAGRRARGGVPRARPGGGRHVRRTGGLRGAARRPGPAPHQRRRDRRGLQDRDGQGARGDGRLVRSAAAVRLRRRGDHQRCDRLLLRAAQGRQPRRGVLHERLRARGLGPLRDREHQLPRGDPGPSPAARDRRGARRRPGVPQAGLHRGVRRGLGALHRAARRRDGALLHAARPDRDARRGLDAGLPAGRGHGHARARVEPAAGHRLHDGELPDAAPGTRPRRSTATP